MPGETCTAVREAIGTVQKVDSGVSAVTVDFGAGRRRKVQAGDDVELSGIRAEDTVKARYVEHLSISVVSVNPLKPKME